MVDASEARGYVAPGFEKVAEVLATTAEAAGEEGVGVAVTIEGEIVLDLSWGRTEGSPWTSDTLVCVYSCTKGMTALAAQILADRGLLDVEAPVARYWPEYAVNGKEDTLVSHFLNHSAGVLTFPRYWDLAGPDSSGLADFDAMVEQCAAAKPSWVPGTAAGYHALTFGWLVGELVRRIDGRSIGRFLAEEVTGPLGLEAYIGLPPELNGRVAPTLPARPMADPAAQTAADEALAKSQACLQAGDTESTEALALACLFIHPHHPDYVGYLCDLMNNPAIRAAELPAGNAIANAKGLAGFYAPLANDGTMPGGPRIVSPESIERFRTPQPLPDGTPTGYGLGYGLLGEGFGGPGVEGEAFGHGGAGGNIGLADPTRRLSYAYVKNRMVYDAEAAMAPLRALYTLL